MPIKDPSQAREYQRLWIAKKRSRQKNVEPVEPTNNFVEPLKKVGCSRCVFLENEISSFANLYYQEQDKIQEQKQINYQLEKKIKELEKQLRKAKKGENM